MQDIGLKNIMQLDHLRRIWEVTSEVVKETIYENITWIILRERLLWNLCKGSYERSGSYE
jgi:hypothetical protein